MIWFSYDDWIGLFGFFQVELVHWPQYLILFITGSIAYRKNWLFGLKTKTGYVLLAAALFLAAATYTGVFFSSIYLWGIVSSFFAVFIIFGLITLFREKFNKTTPLMNVFSRSSYAAYLVHFPIVLVIQCALDTVSIGGAWGKFIIVSILSIVITYCISYLIIKIKYLNKVL
jgi:peptidoglycan/LPS O-acetylase OafA/YrhL